MTVDPEKLLLYLLAGVTAFAEKDFRYPYPETLIRARGLFFGAAIENERPAHQSMSQFLQMIQQPVGTWWPLKELPENLEPEFVLFSPGCQLLDFAMDWLMEGDRHGQLANVNDVEALAANRYIAEICQQMSGNPSMQADYVEFRRFLIEHPWLDAGIGLSVIPPNVLALMQDTKRYYERVASPNLVRKNRCWQCPRCKGVLTWINDQPVCANGLCNRLVNMEEVEAIPGNDILALRMVFRRRVQLPGLPELELYKQFLSMGGLNVDLWPDGDRYDLRIETPANAWQVDVKDYAEPRALAAYLRTQIPFVGGAPITYVVPSYRDMLLPGYTRQLREMAPGFTILSDDELIERVQAECEAR